VVETGVPVGTATAAGYYDAEQMGMTTGTAEGYTCIVVQNAGACR